MKPQVFLDSGIFIALLNRRDHWHAEAASLFATKPPRWSTSALVVAESYGWFLHRMGEEAARNFRRFVDALPQLTWLGGDDAPLHAATVAVLERFRGAKLGYVDARSLSLIDQHRIPFVWSTDHHLALSGTMVLPRI